MAVRCVPGDWETGRRLRVSSTAGMPGHSIMTRVTVRRCLRLTPCIQHTVSLSSVLESTQDFCLDVNVALTLSVFQITVTMDGVKEQAVVRLVAPQLTVMLGSTAVPLALQVLVSQ